MLAITQSIKLLTNQVIEELRKEFKYIHLGMIQVAINPLTREALNTSLLAYLRYKTQSMIHVAIKPLTREGLNKSLLACLRYKTINFKTR